MGTLFVIVFKTIVLAAEVAAEFSQSVKRGNNEIHFYVAVRKLAAQATGC